jgi:predicted flap endonuclease-1-like 5' DNA nuclease
MNETSATSASGDSLLPDGITTLTTIHFAIIAVLALFVIAGLLWGIKAKRSRKKASRDVIANAREAGVEPAPEPTRDLPAAPTPAAAPAPETPPAPTPKPAPKPTPAPSQSQVQTAPTPIPVARPVAPAPQPVAPAPAPAPAPTPAPLSDEPIAAASFDANPAAEAATPTEAPAPIPAPAPAPAPTPAVDHAAAPVTQLKGLGPKVATRLAELGVTTVGDMAALSETEAQNIDAQLGAFTGRMGRDRWIEQSRLLAAGDKPGFEAVFGKL